MCRIYLLMFAFKFMAKFNCYYEMFLILEVVYNNRVTLHIVRWCSTNAVILNSIYGITILMCILKLVCMQ